MSTQLSSGCQQSLAQLFAQLQSTLEKNSREDANWLQQRQSLTLANALLRNHQERSEQTSKHVVVVGPTQVGKSTVINHLLGSDQAGVSALAGYTRHAQGFTSGSTENGQFEALFPNWTNWTRITPDNFQSLAKLAPLTMLQSKSFTGILQISIRSALAPIGR